jgi:aminoglycoside phosphotransferase (APT) family kinase protein
LTGRTALLDPPENLAAAAAALGCFLRALHHPAPGDAPHNPWRGVALNSRTGLLHEHLEQLNGLVDGDAALDVWERALSSAKWPGPPSWVHGDLHPGNLLVAEGRLAAVIDFGDLAAGDPATDLSIAWMLLPPSARPIFRAAARGDADRIDDDTWMRARGWAVALGLAYLASSRDDAAFAALGRSTVDAALQDW